MNARLGRIGWVAMIVFTCGLLAASYADAPKKSRSRAKAKEAPPPVVVETPASTWPAAELTLGVQVRDSETEGLGDLLIPVWNPGGNGLLFLNPRSAVTDHSAEEYNIGIGYRQLFPKYNFILGANAYYDYRDTSAGHYDQWGAGLELLSTWVDARVNYYDPEDKQLVVASETETSTRQYTRTSSAWLDPYAEEHAVLQDYRVTQTLVTETSTRTFEQYQQPLGGVDWEIGLRLPIQAKNIEARIFGGYYDFDRDFGDDVKGWKARAELRLNSTLFLDAGIYEDDQLTGSDWFAGARIAVPLDFAALSRGRNPFAGAKSRWSGDGRELSARLTEMVMRDPQIRLETSKMLENKQLASQDVQQTKTVQQGAFVLLPDVQFVDGDAPFSGDGSAEFPLTTIQAGANTVFGSRNVYVYNASGPYNENVVLQDGTTLWGSGSLIQGMGGKSYGSGIAPIVDGRSMGPSITMANNTTVRGMHVRNTDMGGPQQWEMLPGMSTHEISRVGIYGPNVTGLAILENTIAGNSEGVLLMRNGDFDLFFDRNDVRDNDANGLWIEALGASGTFNALIQNSRFTDNIESGARIEARNYDLSSVQLRDSTFSRNGGFGARVVQNDSIEVYTMASGIQANDNNLIGLSVEQAVNLISLANLSGITANRNMQGINLFQLSDFMSIGVIGMPDGTGDMVSNLLNLAVPGLVFPPELAAFFAGTGPVTANGNFGTGIQSTILANGFALGTFFDITANDNLGSGFMSVIQSDSVAVGLAASSQNLAEVLELASDAAGLFGLNLPLSLPGGGQMQANNNAGAGVLMQTQGLDFSLNAILGLETVGNAGPGTAAFAFSQELAINAVARLVSTDNLGAGLLMDVFGLNLGAIGLVADTDASRNADSGITVSVDSPLGFAVFASLSTDALRPLAADLLGYNLPGQPFGPVTTHGNVGDGFTAVVTGDDFALAAFLDTQANNNSDAGFNVSVQSANSQAIAAFLSSDMLYDILPDLLGGDPIPGAGLGGVTANVNWTAGIELEVVGESGATAILAGVEANENFADGIVANLASADGGAQAFLVSVDATRNLLGDGIILNLQSWSDALIGMVYVDADWNGGRGVDITANSANASTYALLSAVYPWHNLDGGLFADLSAAQDVALAITDSSARHNSDRGASLFLNAGNDAYLFAGDFAADDLDALFGFSGMIGPLTGLIPTGPISFTDNFGAGFFAEVTSIGGNVFMGINGATASDNANRGFNLNLNAVNGNIMGDILNATASNNGGNGLHLDLTGGGGNLGMMLWGVTTTNNGINGINILDNYTGNAFIGGEQLTSINNAVNGVRIVSDGAGALQLDFGGGGTSGGFSSFFGNDTDFRYNDGTAITVWARNNWWGADANPVPGQTAGAIDATPWLPAPPP